MTILATGYVETPWGIFTQQQFVLFFAYQSWLKGQTTVINQTPAQAVTAAYNFYNTAWPLVEALDL